MMGIYTNTVFDGPIICLLSVVFNIYSSVRARQTFLITDPKLQVTHHPLRGLYVIEGQSFLKYLYTKLVSPRVYMRIFSARRRTDSLRVNNLSELSIATYL